MKETLSSHIGAEKVPGLVALISHGGDTHAISLGNKSYGGDDVQRDTIFRIASMTKPVTATATMILVDEGKVKLDDPVDHFLPELSNRKVLKRIDGPLDETIPARRPITIRDLLTFTMGMGIIIAPPGVYPVQRAMDELRLGQGIPNPRVPPSPDEWIRRLGTLPLLHQPGEQWMYNTGADILGILVRRASGQSFDSFLRDRIFAPLGMRDSGFSVPASKINRFVDSYWTNPISRKIELYDSAKSGQWTRPPDFPSGGGGLVSTADDFFAFASMLMQGGIYNGRRILTEKSVNAMTSNQLSQEQKAASSFVPGFFDLLGWGFCMSVSTGHDPLKSVGTYGWNGGLGTSWFNDPARKLTAILMTQQAQTSPAPPPVYLDFWKSAYAALG
jgi:CubicO group peptidase (beta-lactamase class C family)